MRLSEELVRVKEDLKKKYRGQMIEALEKEILGDSALNDLLEERREIREKISALQQQADTLNSESIKLSEEIRSYEEKTADALQNAKTPSFSQKAREKKSNLSDLQKWQEDLANHIKELENSIGKYSPLTEKISREWHRNLVAKKESWDKEIFEYIITIESIFNAWFDAVSDCAKKYEIIQRGRAPEPKIPFSSFLQDHTRPPH
jgi:uncharacterized protein YlxW (UPF0749 family)